MSVKSQKNIENMLNELDIVYSNLVTVITGTPQKPDPAYGQTSQNNIYIDARSLRLAIDKMSAALKEAKLLAK